MADKKSIFRRAKIETFKQPIDITVGDKVLGAIEFEFLYVRPADLESFNKSQEGKTNVESIAAITRGWSGCQDEQGNDVPYTPEALAKLLDDYHCATRIMSAWYLGLTGALAKN